jgi:hypothetical protein
MTTAADDRAVEQAFEASLVGRPVPPEATGLAAFTSAVRGTATRPGRPNAALAELLSTGLLTDQSSPSTRTAPAAGALPSRSARSRTRRRFTVIVPALLAKFLSAGALAQAATGAGVVVVVAAGAGTAGALPDGAQAAFSDVTGIQQTAEEQVDGDEQLVSDDGTVLADSGDESVTDEDAAAETGEFDAGDWLAAQVPDDYPTFGAWVSDGAHHRDDLENHEALAEYRNFGEVVSERARAKGMDEEALTEELEDAGLDPEDVLEGETDAEQESGTDGEDSADDSSSPGKSDGKGKSAGKGAGKGRSGN